MPTSVVSWPGLAGGGPARSTRSLATGSSRAAGAAASRAWPVLAERRAGHPQRGLLRADIAAAHAEHEQRPARSGEPASSLSAPAEAAAAHAARAAGDSARCLGWRTRRRRAAVADRPCGPAGRASAAAPRASRPAASLALDPRRRSARAAREPAGAWARRPARDGAALRRSWPRGPPRMSSTSATASGGDGHGQRANDAGRHALAIVPRTRLSSLVRVMGVAVCS